MIHESDLKKFISIQSFHSNDLENKNACDYLLARLTGLGFACHIEGMDQTPQPVIVAHRKGIRSEVKVLIYNHYDVVEVDPREPWISDNPFTLKEMARRYYGRGIADNKGPLWARLEALSKISRNGGSCPEILWLIQGEEEVKSKICCSVGIFNRHIKAFGADYYIEETGYHDIDQGFQAIFLWSSGISESLLQSHKDLIAPVFHGKKIKFKYEHLIKFAPVSPCPLLSNLPERAIYIGFGPNDRLHNIHRENESLDKDKLEEHIGQFERFLVEISRANQSKIFKKFSFVLRKLRLKRQISMID